MYRCPPMVTGHSGIYGACTSPCPWCMSMSMLHVHAAHPCSCPCSLLFIICLFACVSACLCAWSCACWCACLSACSCFMHVFMCVFVCMCINAGMPDCPASDQSGTALKKTNDAGNSPVRDQAKAVRHFFGPVPNWNYWCQNANDGVSFHDANAQLWLPVMCKNRYC